MKTVIAACMALLAADVAWPAGEAKNTVALTDAEEIAAFLEKAIDN